MSERLPSAPNIQSCVCIAPAVTFPSALQNGGIARVFPEPPITQSQGCVGR